MQQMPGQEARPKAKALVSEKMQRLEGAFRNFLRSVLVKEIIQEENTVEETLWIIYVLFFLLPVCNPSYTKSSSLSSLGLCDPSVFDRNQGSCGRQQIMDM